MSAYSKDFRARIVLAVEGGMSKALAARTFSVSLSSQKRYVNKTERGEFEEAFAKIKNLR
jgi:transposase